MENVAIKLQSIDKIYLSSSGNVSALRKVNLTILSGEHIAIIGKSGSGKSTLLNIISGIDRPSSGKASVLGSSLNKLNEKSLANWRGEHVGIVFQFYHLFPTLSAIDNVLFSMDLVGKIKKSERRQRAEKLLGDVGLLEKQRKFPNELSGGEKQRIAIARALANDPPLIIADEPTGNLDLETGIQIKKLFATLNNQGKTILIVTHEQIKAHEYDRVFQITDGVVLESVREVRG